MSKLNKNLKYSLIFISIFLFLALSLLFEMYTVFIKSTFFIGVILLLLRLNEKATISFVLIIFFLYFSSALWHDLNFIQFIYVQIAAILVILVNKLYQFELKKCAIIGVLIMISIIPNDLSISLVFLSLRDVLLFVVSVLTIDLLLRFKNKSRNI